MTERMKINRRKKLLLNGVVVGYMAEISEYHEPLDCDLVSIKFKRLTGKWQNVATQLDVSVVPDFDCSLEGIELPNGKGWLFDGDKVKRTWGTLTVTGTLYCDNYGWCVENDNPSGLESRRIFGGSIWTWDDLTLVDKEERNDKTYA